jgi:hypothetical protein
VKICATVTSGTMVSPAPASGLRLAAVDTQQMTLRHRQQQKRPGMKTKRGAYTLVMRTPDGRLNYERFDDAASYRARLMALQPSSRESASIEDILGLLDA